MSEPMRTRRLGRDGPEVSVLALGCNSFGLRIGLAETRDIVDAALDCGITLFDTADLYGRTDSERYLGQALGRRRDDVVVATKWGWTFLEGAPEQRRGIRKRPVPRGSEAYIRFAIEGSLRRLETDRIDLYQYHKIDEDSPLEETFSVLGDLVREGKIRWVGLPTLDPPRLRETMAVAARLDVPVVSMQLQYSLIRREVERDILPACDERGVGVLAYLPLEGGLLTGKYRRDAPVPADSRYASMPLQWPRDQWLTDDAFERTEQLERFAVERGASLLDVAIGGLAAMPGVGAVLTGATRPEQVRSNAAAARWVPSSADLEALNALARPAHA
jgi:aryl-alcohol dehydrogenase-like predicted oxidoreductase